MTWLDQGRQEHGYFGHGTSAGTPLVLVADDGTPKNNQAQNKQFKAACQLLGLTPAQKDLLHREISGQNCSFKEIVETGRSMFGK